MRLGRTRQAELPFLLWQESTPQHYDSPNGDYLEPPASHECRPVAGIQQDEANGLQTSLEWMRVSPSCSAELVRVSIRLHIRMKAGSSESPCQPDILQVATQPDGAEVIQAVVEAFAELQ